MQSKKLMEKLFFVYIIASKRNGTLYIGVTSDLVKRISQHKIGEIEGFTIKFWIPRSSRGMIAGKLRG
jgi:putative endonuclease